MSMRKEGKRKHSLERLIVEAICLGAGFSNWRQRFLRNSACLMRFMSSLEKQFSANAPDQITKLRITQIVPSHSAQTRLQQPQSFDSPISKLVFSFFFRHFSAFFYARFYADFFFDRRWMRASERTFRKVSDLRWISLVLLSMNAALYD